MRTSISRVSIAFVLLFSTARAALAQEDRLPSWNEGASKSAITSFVAKVTKDG